MSVGKLMWKLLNTIDAEGNDLPGGTLPEEPSPVDDGDKWASFMDEDEVVEDDAGAQGEEPTAPVEPEPTPSAAPNEPTVAAEPSVQPQPVAPVAQPQATPEEVAAARKAYEAQIASRYQISEDDALLFQTEPEKVLPQFAAKVYADVMQDVTQQIMGVMPQVIQGYVASTTKETQAQEAFFSAWPELKGHDQQVLQMGAMYRQMNPIASPQEAIEVIGEMTMAALKLKRAQAQGVNAPVAVQQQFRPAAPGHVQTPAPTKTKWEAVMDDDD